jgi:hypothetical protein
VEKQVTEMIKRLVATVARFGAMAASAALRFAAVTLTAAIAIIIGPSQALAVEAPEVPPALRPLVDEIKGKSPYEVEKISRTRLGEPTRDIGSGVSILQWELQGGTWTVHQLAGASWRYREAKRPTFAQVTLIENKRIKEAVPSASYEMTSLPTGKYGSKTWWGNIKLKDGQYKFIPSSAAAGDSDANKNHPCPGCFLFANPTGTYALTYVVDSNKLFKEFKQKTVVARLALTGAKAKQTYDLVYDPAVGSIGFSGGDANRFMMY